MSDFSRREGHSGGKVVCKSEIPTKRGEFERERRLSMTRTRECFCSGFDLEGLKISMRSRNAPKISFSYGGELNGGIFTCMLLLLKRYISIQSYLHSYLQVNELSL